MLKIIPLRLRNDTMNPVFVDDGAELLLIDCGTSDSFELICEAARKAGIDVSRLTKIIITHHDHDHVGTLADMINAAPGVTVIASEPEKPYIEGEIPPVRLVQAQEALEDVNTTESREDILARMEMLKALKPGRVDIIAKDGDRFDWCGGVRIIATPGHMPGHIVVYIEELKTLITGDTLTIFEGRLASAKPMYTLDMAQAKDSVQRLSSLVDIENIICYHGGVLAGDAKAALRDVIAEWPL